MERRKFFKMFGAVSAAPFVPFKWEAGKKAVRVNPVTKQDEPKSQMSTPVELFIDNVRYTGVCRSLEFGQNHSYDITCLGEEYRRWHPGSKYVKMDLYHFTTFEIGGWHHIEVRFEDKTMMSFKAQLTSSSTEAVAGDVVRTHLEFVAGEL